MTVVTFGLCVTLFYSILVINTCEPCSYIKNLNFSAIISFYPQMRGLRTELVCVETLDWQASLGSGRLNRSPVKVLSLHCQVERLQGALPKQAGESSQGISLALAWGRLHLWAAGLLWLHPILHGGREWPGAASPLPLFPFSTQNGTCHSAVGPAASFQLWVFLTFLWLLV